MSNTSMKVADTVLIDAKSGVKWRNKTVRYRIAVFLVMASSLFIPVAAHASDWEEYALVCFSNREQITFHTKDGDKEYSTGHGRLLVWVSIINGLIDKGWQPLQPFLSGLDIGHLGGCQVMVKD